MASFLALLPTLLAYAEVDAFCRAFAEILCRTNWPLGSFSHICNGFKIMSCAILHIILNNNSINMNDLNIYDHVLGNWHGLKFKNTRKTANSYK